MGFVPIPERLSQAGEHVIHIQVLGEGGRVGVNGQVSLTDAASAHRLKRQQQTIELVLPLAYAGMALCALSLALLWGDRRDLRWLALFCVGWVALVWLKVVFGGWYPMI